MEKLEIRNKLEPKKDKFKTKHLGIHFETFDIFHSSFI